MYRKKNTHTQTVANFVWQTLDKAKLSLRCFDRFKYTEHTARLATHNSRRWKLSTTGGCDKKKKQTENAHNLRLRFALMNRNIFHTFFTNTNLLLLFPGENFHAWRVFSRLHCCCWAVQQVALLVPNRNCTQVCVSFPSPGHSFNALESFSNDKLSLVWSFFFK